MPSKIGFLHTTPATISLSEQYMRKVLPDFGWLHYYDGRVKEDNFAARIGEMPKANLLRFAQGAKNLEESGCSAIVSCCSLMGKATAFAAHVVDVPCVQLDAPILEKAAAYDRIGLIHTTERVVPCVENALVDYAKKAEKKPPKLVYTTGEAAEAISLFNLGDYVKHDAIVLAEMRRMEREGVECILMGQIPFALMEEKIEALQWSVPVLYAGAAMFEHVGQLAGLKNRGVL